MLDPYVSAHRNYPFTARTLLTYTLTRRDRVALWVDRGQSACEIVIGLLDGRCAMPQEIVQEKTVGTGHWNLDAPISFFAYATYKRRNGKVVQMPIQVAGEQITGAHQGTAAPQS
jgi:hypothetical protein